jgi:hypothetical protein
MVRTERLELNTSTPGTPVSLIYCGQRDALEPVFVPKSFPVNEGVRTV